VEGNSAGLKVAKKKTTERKRSGRGEKEELGSVQAQRGEGMSVSP